jgi:hypothetical protein
MKFILFSTLASIFSCYGALSPYFQSTKEIKEIVSSSYLETAIPQNETILEICLKEQGVGYRIYVVKTESKLIEAKLVYKMTPKLAAKDYSIDWSLIEES